MPIRTAPRESTGNATLLVLVNSAEAEHGQVPESVLSILGHCGLPYRLRDLARGRLAAGEVEGHAAAVLAQEHLGLAMTPDDVKVLLGAVEQGVGLVGIDHDLGAYPGALAQALGLGGSHWTGRIVADGTEGLGVPANGHFVTWTQEAGALHRLRMPVPVALARAVGAGATVLAENAAGAPALVAARIGRGRALQWLVSPKLWLRQYLGHAGGLDDLFWKGLVWAARKPFAMMAMPPFVRLRFDDCTGLWRTAADLAFARLLADEGHVPSLCVCLRAVTGDGAGALRALADAGQADIAPHTLEGGMSLFHGDAAGEYGPARLREIFREVDERLARWGIRPSRILSDHDHEWSAGAVPFLLERGIRYKMNITLPGERWTDPHVDWRPGPYGSMSYALDYLPGDGLGEFFAVFNHCTPAFDAARAYLPDGRFLYNRPGGFGAYKWDFLNGLTRQGDAVRDNDVEAAARRLAAHTRLGLDSLFFGGSISHSHFTRHLSPGEWRAILARYEALTARHAKRNAGYDAIAAYARARADSHLAHAEREPGGRMRCRLTGAAEVPLELYVFRDVDDGVEHRFQVVPAFRGSAEAAF
jgi:hypothetical protein